MSCHPLGWYYRVILVVILCPFISSNLTSFSDELSNFLQHYLLSVCCCPHSSIKITFFAHLSYLWSRFLLPYNKAAFERTLCSLNFVSVVTQFDYLITFYCALVGTFISTSFSSADIKFPNELKLETCFTTILSTSN